MPTSREMAEILEGGAKRKRDLGKIFLLASQALEFSF
jgi:hypothetical protein